MPARFRRASRRALEAALVVAAWSSAGCKLSPPLHPVEIAPPGHVTAALSGQVGQSLQASFQLGVGVAPHLQLEASGATATSDAGASNGGSAGLRTELPLWSAREGGSVSLQLAALYGHAYLAGGVGCGHDDWFFPSSCTPSGTLDTANAELGLVGRTGAGRSPAVGFWIAGGLGHAQGLVDTQEEVSFARYRSRIAQAALSFSVEIPFDDARHLNALLGGTVQGTFVNELDTNPQPSVYSAGAGLVLRY